MSAPLEAPAAPLGILAGLGDLPVQVAAAARERGQPVYILRLKGFVEPQLADYPGEIVALAELGKIYSAFRKAGCRQICFAGIVKRPDLAALKPDLKGLSLLPKVIAAASQGDDALLQLMVKSFEAECFEIIGADVAAGLLQAASGLFAGAPPDETSLGDLRKAAHIASQLGRLDIGQGAIVCRGLVLCVEAQEGTDCMLARCADLPDAVRGTIESPHGVLVKRPKPQQDRRIDLPTIGLATLNGAYQAGLKGIGYEAGGALLLNADALHERATELGLFLYGFPGDWS